LYRIDSTRVSLREYWWGSHSPAILIAALLKLLRIRIPSATDAMPFLRFEDPFEGPPALVKWLRDRGCTDFRYDLTPGFAPGQDVEEDEL
jgi:hypothetical protein